MGKQCRRSERQEVRDRHRIASDAVGDRREVLGQLDGFMRAGFMIFAVPMILRMAVLVFVPVMVIGSRVMRMTCLARALGAIKKMNRPGLVLANLQGSTTGRDDQ